MTAPSDDAFAVVQDLFCVSQNGIVYICPSKKNTSNENNLVNATNKTQFNLNEAELKSRFNRRMYKFNVTVSVYSKDLLIDLEASVMCRVEILNNELGSRNEAYVLNAYDAKSMCDKINN